MKKILFLYLLAFSFVCNAQIIFEPGYFISNNGTKTDVLIKNLGWKNAPIEFEYTFLTGDKDVKKAYLNEVNEFAITNKYKFKKFTVNIDKSSNKIEKMDYNKNPQWQEETFFLKIIVEGEINLYEYSNGELKRYFISSGDHMVAEQLIYKEYYVEQNKTAKNNDFRQQLYLKLKSSDKLTSKDFEKLKYNEYDLKNLLIQYNGTKVSNYSNIVVKEEKGSLHLKALAGVSSNKLSFNYDKFNLDPNILSGFEYDFETKITYKVGLELEYILPFNQKKWSLFIAPNYQSYKAEGTYNNEKIKAEYNHIEIPVGLRYATYLNLESKIFFDFGYSFISSSNSFLSYDGYDGYKFEIQNKGNFFLGAGYNYKKYSVEGRFNFSRELLEDYSIEHYKLWNGQMSSISLLFSYTIF